jgi:hypothetical protein
MNLYLVLVQGGLDGRYGALGERCGIGCLQHALRRPVHVYIVRSLYNYVLIMSLYVYVLIMPFTTRYGTNSYISHTYLHSTYALSPMGQQRHFRYSS